MATKNVIDLFCGAGGMSSGFRDAGYGIIAGIDNNPVYLASFHANHPTAKAVLCDIHSLTAHKIKSVTGGVKIHVVLGGLPCQSFSTARRRNPHDERNYLWRDFVRIVSLLKPEFFVIENVTGILSAKNSRNGLIKDDIIRNAAGIGYGVDYRILNTANFGVPQSRRRVVFLGTRLRVPLRFPTGKKGYVPVGKVLLKRNSVSEQYFYSWRLIRGFRRRVRDNKRRGFGFRWQFLNPDLPSYTIPARYGKDGANALVAYDSRNIRMLTELECARIQGFPDGYTFCGNKRQKYEQIGNAVPPPVAKTIGEVLYANGEPSSILRGERKPMWKKSLRAVSLDRVPISV